MTAGIVGIACSDSARYHLFTEALQALDLPDGWQVRLEQGSDRATGRNRLAGLALDLGAERILFLDDDQVFHPQLLHRLLQHVSDRPFVVGGLYMKRVYPFHPIAYQSVSDGKYLPLLLTEHEEGDLVQVLALGTGAMLIPAQVLRSVGGEEGPWFSYGVNGSEMVSEDIVFCEKLRQQDIPLYVDLHAHARVGHITSAVVWPVHQQEWQVGFTVGLGGGFSLRCPIGTDLVEAAA